MEIRTAGLQEHNDSVTNQACPFQYRPCLVRAFGRGLNRKTAVTCDSTATLVRAGSNIQSLTLERTVLGANPAEDI